MGITHKICRIILILLIACASLPQSVYSQVIFPAPDYVGFIQDKIHSFFVYPPEAQIRSWEGVVKVRFTLAQDGRIKDIDIAESSGYPLLDAAAILAIKDASPYPFPENYSFERDLEIILPVIYEKPKAAAKAAPEESSSSSPQLTYVQPLPSEVKKEPALPSNNSSVILPEQVNDTQLPLTKAQTPPQNDSESQAEPAVSQTQPEIPDPAELTYFSELALENNQPTKVAREEIELAQLKVTEAQRGLFPNLKVSAYNTKGDVFKVDYEEREAKIQVDQPIYYGGRLKDTSRQAKVNLEITEKNYDRLKLDVMHKTETAYYNLVAAKMNLKLKDALRQEAKELLGKIEKLSEIGMTTPLEASSAAAWYKQIEFQIDSIKHDMFMAELTFKQVLNIKEVPRIEAGLLEARELNLDLGTCLEAALQHRPEVYLSELLVKFNDYGQKIEESKERDFQIDLTGSYGHYQGAFVTEKMRSSDNWYAGVKVSKPWGGNTLNSSYTSERTQPRFGQTSATGSSTISADFSLLDNLKRLSDKKKSDIDLHRSLSDFNESAKTVAFEVQDAFLGYQKSVLQLNAAEAEMKFRRTEAEVTKVRSMVGEASLSSAMESLFSLSEAQTKYIQALANYQISLANLKKASGYGIKI